MREENKVKLEKLRVDKMVVEYKINEFEKILKQREQITWLRMRAKIVDLARAILDHMGLDKEWEDLNRSIEAREKELNTIKTEVFFSQHFTNFRDSQFSFHSTILIACHFRFLPVLS